MWDTVRASVSGCSLDTARLLSRGFTRIESSKSDVETGELSGTVRYNLMRKGEYPHYLSYAPESGTLVSETSLPKLVFNSNVVMLAPDTVPGALVEWSNRVSDLVGDVQPLPRWDVRGRLDACFAWDVNFDGRNHVGDYLNAFRDVGLSRHYSQNVDRESTLYWRNGSRVIRMYDKEKESSDDSAVGLLRFEVELKHAKKELGFSGGELKIGDALTWDYSRSVLEKYLLGLGADLVVADEKILFGHLVDYYGFPTARRLYGSLMASRMYDDGQIKSKWHIDRKMLWRDRQQIKKSGVSSGVARSGILPALVIPSQFDGSPGVVVA